MKLQFEQMERLLERNHVSAMKRDALLAILIEIVSLVLAPLVPVAVLFRERKPLRTDMLRIDGHDSSGELAVDRTQLPRWLWWFQTPDEPLPGGLYEPTVRKWLIKYGYYWCSVLWLLRNRLYGLSWAFGKPADGYLDPVPGLVRRGDLWRWWRQIGPVVLQAGWKVHRKDFDAHWDTGPLWAIPFISLRLRKNA